MKKIITLFVAAFALVSCAPKTQYLEVVSFNVRLDHEGDGANQWPYRVPLVKRYLDNEQPAVLGMQEVLPNQLKDLREMLDGYGYVGAGRDDGESSGEACPVFYRQDTFEKLASGHFWLSETPDIPGSMSWGTHYPRIVSWVKLELLGTGKPLFVFNTHFSHISEEARTRSASLLLKQIEKLAGSHPVILTGDFNTPAGSVPYNKLVTGEGTGVSLSNAEDLASETYNGAITYNAFDPGFEGSRIDFIFVSDHFNVRRHWVDEVKEGNLFISDHYPVRAGVEK